MNAAGLFENSLELLKNNYGSYNFFHERDIEWTLQLYLTQIINDKKLGYRVFNNYNMRPGKRGPITDLVIIANDGTIELAVELKYEPSHKRIDISKYKFPVAVWAEIGKDIIRIKEYVEKGIARAGYSILFDEDGYWRDKKENKETFSGSSWGPIIYASFYKLSLLTSKAPL